MERDRESERGRILRGMEISFNARSVYRGRIGSVIKSPSPVKSGSIYSFINSFSFHGIQFKLIRRHTYIELFVFLRRLEMRASDSLDSSIHLLSA
jgi:hypothetical protein